MAPISPISRKRSTPSHDDEDQVDERASKRARKETPLHSTPPPELEITAKPATSEFFDDGPHQLLMRSVALTLEHVGFSGASPESMEALCAEAESYASTFLSQITTSMLHSRRPLPTPLDFEYALKKFSLPLASLEPHLKPPIPASKLRIHLDSPPAEDKKADKKKAESVTRLLGKELNGDSDKKSKAYIPRVFPSFPSKHTYKFTEKVPKRETDARKIREEASVQARQGEDALRRLTAVSKAGKEKGIKQAAERDPKSKQRHDLWEETMGHLAPPKKDNLGAVKDIDRSMIVNANKSYHRKGAVTKRKQSIQLPQ